ncbi:MAG: hypothetical protein WDO13_16240 [Verrucomicrobiota bacterium]
MLFFHPFENLESAESAGKALVYMEDCMYAYTLTPWEVAAHRELRPVYRLNSGMMLVRGERLDLAFIEHLLKRHPQFRRNWQVEQDDLGHPRAQVRLAAVGPAAGDRRRRRLPARVRPGGRALRHPLAPPAGGIPRRPAADPPGGRVALRAEPPAPYSILQLTRDHLRNKVHNTLHRLRTAAGSGS